jgi:hypothetical protein
MARSLRPEEAPAVEIPHVAPRLDALPSIPTAAVFSFLKDTQVHPEESQPIDQKVVALANNLAACLIIWGFKTRPLSLDV